MNRMRNLWLTGVAAAIAIAAVAASQASNRAGRDALMRADPERSLADPRLAPVALRIGRTQFADHCASCHQDGRPDRGRGVPDLTDGEHLYGTGSVAEIEQIVLYGIRSGSPRGWNLAAMPAYASAKPSASEPVPAMTPRAIADVTQYLMQRRGNPADAPAAGRGAILFAGSGGCWDCHAADGGGNDAIGAPSLIDDVWLYGDGSAASIARSIAYGRHGFSPAFKSKLSPVEARAVAVYVASLSQPQRIAR
ncbi:c-type cytochrome [Sphingomonas sp.]|uniref:c-type cytochrome n=1 Tax=Sphingomonas sp. TaxID=28214 RepID=UPI0025FD180A|nr:c-type cytochrome [Sphingomonas sp.]